MAGRPSNGEGNAKPSSGALIRITAPYFTAGGVVGDPGSWAPILGYMRRWPLSRISVYCKKRRFDLEILDA
jgi:hypothetical protein